MNEVHIAVARYLRISPEAILDEHRLKEDLGLDALDLVTIVLQLEQEEPYHGEFPVGELENARTVEDLVCIYIDWSERDTIEQIMRVSMSEVVVTQ